MENEENKNIVAEEKVEPAQEASHDLNEAPQQAKAIPTGEVSASQAMHDADKAEREVVKAKNKFSFDLWMLVH
jgi:hypothetical protein